MSETIEKRTYQKGTDGAIWVFSGSLDECAEMMAFYIDGDLEELLKRAEGIP